MKLSESLFRTRLKQFLEYVSLKNKEMKMSNELTANYKNKLKNEKEYGEFKKSLIYEIDKYFNQGKTKIVIVPKKEKIILFEMMLNDREFNSYYNLDIKNGREIEISLKEI